MFKKGATVQGGGQTIFGPGTLVTGKVETGENVVVGGILEGDLTTGASILIEPGAKITGNVTAESVTVSGEVKGDIRAGSEVVITPTGQVHGDITTAVLSISPGAVFTGKSIMKQQKETTLEIKPKPEQDEAE